MTLQTVLCICTGIGCFLWVIAFIRIIYSLARVQYLENVHPNPPVEWPKLSVIVAACNEEETIKEAMTSLLSVEYPDLELICVNDRSTDATGKLMEELAAERENVQIIHIERLPDGWMGKIHALNEAVKVASGDWVLFTDADVHFSRDALSKTIAHALEERTDHLALFPCVRCKPFWLRVVIRAFTVLFLTRFKVERLVHASNSAFVGSGSFNLFRKSVLNDTPGLEWLKMDVVDDVGLGLMLHKAGARSLFAMAGDAVGVEWYPDLSSMFRGLSKNTFGSVAHYSNIRTLITFAGSILFLLAPATAILWLGSPIWLETLGWLGIVMLLTTALIHRLRNPRNSILLSLLLPVGLLLLTLISVYSMIVCNMDGGVNWRGTHYSLSELKENQRLKL